MATEGDQAAVDGEELDDRVDGRGDRVLEPDADPRATFRVGAAMGDHAADLIGRYAAYRVGYHRGLDALRANGWRGSGYVRWEASTNRGFLRCLLGLHVMATAIGEEDEAARCAQFLQQLDPSGVPAEAIAAIPAP